jgi:Protein of unknown function (DUF2384)
MSAVSRNTTSNTSSNAASLPVSQPLAKTAQIASLRGHRLAKGQTDIVDKYAMGFAEAMEIERNGVPVEWVFKNGEILKISNARLLDIFNIPKSTAAHKLKAGSRFEGVGAQAYLRLERMIGLAQSIAENSLHPDAKNFDFGRWLGEWIEQPQPALGGIKPADMMDTEVGGQRVLEVLAALESGSYQ